MAIRLIECRRVLKQTGSIYLHCDSTMSHYLKIVMDCIFGENNFRNEITWKRTSSHNDGSMFGKITDIILYYRKTDKTSFNNVYIPREDLKSYFPKIDNNGRRYRPEKIDGKGIQNTRIVFGHSVTSPNGRMFWSQEKIDEAIKEDRIIYDPKKHKKPYQKKYMDEDIGNQIQNLWTDISTTTMKKSEKTKYPTQKPLALLERIIKASSNEGDVVLDPFCGCATTCVAAEKLNRKWIGIDISHKAYELVKQRLEKEVPADMLRKEPNFSTVTPTRGENVEKELGNVYIISNKAFPGKYKVGIAKNVKSRLNNYQTSDPSRSYILEYSYETPYFKEIEKYVHEKFENEYEWVNAKIEDIKTEIENFKI